LRAVVRPAAECFARSFCHRTGGIDDGDIASGDLVRDKEIMELAHAEARALVAQGPLAPDLSHFAQTDWPAQFGLIQVG